jgi:type I restriction enzyme S subunit
MKPSNLLQACNHKITALEQEAAFLDELFRAVLEELMTGRLSKLLLVEEKAMN